MIDPKTYYKSSRRDRIGRLIKLVKILSLTAGIICLLLFLLILALPHPGVDVRGFQSLSPGYSDLFDPEGDFSSNRITGSSLLEGGYRRGQLEVEATYSEFERICLNVARRGETFETRFTSRVENPGKYPSVPDWASDQGVRQRWGIKRFIADANSDAESFSVHMIFDSRNQYLDYAGHDVGDLIDSRKSVWSYIYVTMRATH